MTDNEQAVANDKPDGKNITMSEMEMIKTLSATGKYDITPKKEKIPGFGDGFVGTSTPYTGYCRGEPDLDNNESYLVKAREVPKIPQFSGEDPPVKGDVSYREWRFEVQCLTDDPEITDSLLSQAIRRSLRGTARRRLMSLGNSPDLTLVLSKLDNFFGDVSTNGMIMQEFFNSFQKPDESVTDFGCRLESMLHVAVEHGYLDPFSKSELLRHKFWTSLSSDRLKSQTRHKYDTIKDFDLLLREIRMVDKEINLQNTVSKDSASSSTSKGVKARQHAVQSESVTSSECKSLEERFHALEKDMNTKMELLLEKLDTLGNKG
ncbi:uncharacterized protein LOC117315300 [Pecten maximus]|uniref:uncharacterized protein LOC117315300 n=1 Tax=Pecten maximus TaxID=6579 RepID=UPI00145810C2|nr:uncharacterized protein LOC117315300 [Pecten maximus]